MVEYSKENNLPTRYAATGPTEHSRQVNLSLLEEPNQNIKSGQKLLLENHYRFGHINILLIQQIICSEGFVRTFAAANKCQVPKFSIYNFANWHQCSTKDHIHTLTPAIDGFLKVDDLRHCSTISIDHIEFRWMRDIFDSFVKSTSDKFIWGCIFIDHASTLVPIHSMIIV